jgi:hypothetical protein
MIGGKLGKTRTTITGPKTALYILRYKTGYISYLKCSRVVWSLTSPQLMTNQPNGLHSAKTPPQAVMSLLAYFVIKW